MKIVVSTGEISGDLHGAALISTIKELFPQTTFIGMGSAKMRAAGADILFDMTPQGTIGLIEALPNIFKVYKMLTKMKKLLRKEKPDALLLIDTQGFNILLAEYAKKIGIKTIYYIPPQEWLWGTQRGIRKIAKTIDLIISIFENENSIYLNAGGHLIYFGHPLLDIVKPLLSQEERQKRFNAGNKKLVCLCPGSRLQEINKIFPVLLEAAKIIQGTFPDISFIVPISSQWIKNNIEEKINESGMQINMVEGYQYDVISVSSLVIAASGTINMEASILGTPNIMAYMVNPLTYWIGKYILRIDKKIKFFSMPNILLNYELVPEFVQSKARPDIIADKAIEILKSQKRLDNKKLLQKLGNPPVLSKIAGKIIDFINKN
ncbi:lipid-A-disaccharide synthase [candidate division WOR-1 bacterium RIFOXYA2_FULL_36_21]|nr:MAG: lipid-A-disaccharide synthase [candidate division WOR-1 bacterium RIFOXYA2_FULL_36_21]OGC18732.1 MAG: lipid-A-disaccharide synthase [candidate division WOR-1 bacterium RIFOXYA12_FULL_36_13]